MRLKKHANKNEYISTPSKLWVRNFTKNLVPYIDINKITNEKDYFLFLQNEFNNSKGRIPWIDAEGFHFKKIVIVSSGYQFKEKQELLNKFPPDVIILGVNNVLNYWKITRPINYYVVNNPYQECITYLPKGRELPKCILSSKTHWQFVQAYRGIKYRYSSVNTVDYSGVNNIEIEYQIDDYRNPICGAIGLAYRFGVEKLLLFCCDDSFANERPGAEKLHNNYWQYPQQRLSHELIDANLFWLKKAKTEIGDHSSGDKYKNAIYINNIDDFFKDTK